MADDFATKTPDPPAADSALGAPVDEKPSESQPADSPSAASETPESQPREEKVDLFHPEMPQIPGVRAGRPGANAPNEAERQRQRLVVGIAGGAIMLSLILFFWTRSKSSGADDTSNISASNQSAPTPAPPAPAPPSRDDLNVAATTEELSKAWSAKKFTFVKPYTWETVDAMVVRLPGGALWAFSLVGPYGRCDLEYVTDLKNLASQYGYRASHPMVVSPCDGTVYDPLRAGSLGGNTYARGDIVKGNGLRPPISIDVKVSGHSIIADNIE